MTHMSKDDLDKALALAETLAWADGLLTEARKGLKSPKGSLAGQVEELRLRLQSHLANVEAIEPVKHHRLYQRTVRFMALHGLTEFKSHHGHAYRADYQYEVEVEDTAKAIETIERFGHHVERAYLVSKRGTSFVPDCRYQEDRDGEIRETVGYWADVNGFDGKCSVMAFLRVDDEAGTVLKIKVHVKAPDFGRRHEPAVRERGRIIKAESWHYFDKSGYFPKSIKFSVPAGQSNPFYGY